jgi:hypothetical protein
MWSGRNVHSTLHRAFLSHISRNLSRPRPFVLPISQTHHYCCHSILHFTPLIHPTSSDSLTQSPNAISTTSLTFIQNAATQSGFSQWKGLGCSKHGLLGIRLHFDRIPAYCCRPRPLCHSLALQAHQLNSSPMLWQHSHHCIHSSDLFRLCLACVSSQRSLQMRCRVLGNEHPVAL